MGVPVPGRAMALVKAKMKVVMAVITTMLAGSVVRPYSWILLPPTTTSDDVC
jgi:hypothetical protein